MADNTSIEWADTTWNPIIGCTKISDGCDHCYPIPLARIREKNPNPKVAAAFAGVVQRTENGLDWTGQVNLLPDRLAQPLRWRKPRRVFVNSLADLFHEQVPDEYIAKVWAVMALASRHTYLVLTKRHGRMRSLLGNPKFRPLCEQAEDAILTDPSMPFSQYELNNHARRWWSNHAEPLRNVHVGVSVENQKWASIRIPALLDTPAAVRWISAEPLLGPVDLTQWLEEETICGCPSALGERGVSSGRGPGTGDRLAGADLAASGAPGRPVEWVRPDDPMHTPPRRASDGDIPTGSRDVRRRAGARDGAPVGVAASTWADSSGSHCEPQERRQDGQSAAQPRAGDAGRTGTARAARATTGQAGPIRPAQRDGEADHQAGSGDLLSPGGWRAPACPRCGLRRPGADDLKDRKRRPTLSWIVVGGESGPGARPMHPAWAGALRDQCVSAGVPFFFKQWGEWGPAPFIVRVCDPQVGWQGTDEELAEAKRRAEAAGATHVHHGHWRIVGGHKEYFPPHEIGHKPWSLERVGLPEGMEPIRRWGKKRAGRELDGRTWDAFPETASAGAR